MEKCKNCEIIHNGSIIKVSEDGRCIFCGRKVGSSVPNNTKKEEKNKEEECKYCDSHDLKCPKNSSPQSPLSEERERIIDWCKKRMEHNKIQYGTDKWNGDMEDLVELLSGNKE